MPTICTFDGIIITMLYDDHVPPHFHARYGSDQALVHIDPVRIAEGALPRRQARQVLAWAQRRQRALRENWQLAQQHLPLKRIDP